MSTKHYDYKPFGDTLGAAGEKRIGFRGEERDKENGYFAMGFRQYDPQSGRFLSIDPLMAQFPTQTPYQYCFNNPVSFKDPTGLSPEGEKKGKERVLAMKGEVDFEAAELTMIRIQNESKRARQFMVEMCAQSNDEMDAFFAIEGDGGGSATGGGDDGNVGSSSGGRTGKEESNNGINNSNNNKGTDKYSENDPMFYLRANENSSNNDGNNSEEPPGFNNYNGQIELPPNDTRQQLYNLLNPVFLSNPNHEVGGMIIRNSVTPDCIILPAENGPDFNPRDICNGQVASINVGNVNITDRDNAINNGFTDYKWDYHDHPNFSCGTHIIEPWPSPDDFSISRSYPNVTKIVFGIGNQTVYIFNTQERVKMSFREFFGR